MSVDIRIFRIVLIFCVAVGGAGLALFSRGEDRLAIAKRDPMSGFYPAGMPRYPRAIELPAGETRVGQGKIKMSYFKTNDYPEKVGDYYAAYWRKQGFWVNQDLTHMGGVIAAVDAKNGMLYQLSLKRRGDITIAFPAVNLNPRGGVTNGKEPPITLFKKSKILANTETRSSMHHVAQTILSVNSGTLEENRDHYRKSAEQKAFRLDNPKLRKKMGITENLLIYRNAKGDELTIMFSMVEKEKTRVHLTLVRGR